MEIINISNIDTPITTGSNFTFKEFYLPAKREFKLYSCIPFALQIIRDYFKVKWYISSTYRPNDPLSMPEAHRVEPPAVDSVPLDKNIRLEIINKIRLELKQWRNSQLIRPVLDTGCNIIIIEPPSALAKSGLLHIHYRNYNLNFPKEYPNGIYLGEWKPSATNPRGENICYSI